MLGKLRRWRDPQASAIRCQFGAKRLIYQSAQAEVTLALRGLICNQKTADVGRVGVPLNSTQRPENEVDTLWVRVEDCPMIPKKNYLMLNRLTLG